MRILGIHVTLVTLPSPFSECPQIFLHFVVAADEADDQRVL